MPIWAFVAIWIFCGLAIALLLGRALRSIDEHCDLPEQEPEPIEWPELRVERREREVLR